VESYIPNMSGVLAVFCCALTWATLFSEEVPVLKSQLINIWYVAEIFLFTFTGTSLNLTSFGPNDTTIVWMVFVGLLARLLGISLVFGIQRLFNDSRSVKDLLQLVLFFWVCTWPKATVQAALGGVPQAQHLIPGRRGDEIAAFIASSTALAVLLMAPVGIFATAFIGYSLARRLLENEPLSKSFSANHDHASIEEPLIGRGDAEPDR